MNDNQFVSSNGDGTLSSTPSAVFDALHQPLCRAVARHVAERECPVSLSELVEFCSASDAVPTQNQRRITIELHHNHLPRLADYGFITYDAREKTVERTPDTSTLETWLVLVSRDS